MGNWNDEEKPREKIQAGDANQLSNAELLAILIGSGTKDENVLALARRILKSCDNSLQQLGKQSISSLQQFKGVGKVKATKIVAALALGKRSIQKESIKKISESYDIFSLTRGSLGSLNHEEFWVFYLDHSNHILHKTVLSKGGLTGTLVDVRIMMKYAFEYLATGIILCHNHPSGNISPSNADKQITKKIKNACQTLDIRLLDHIIVTPMAYFSFLDEAIL